MRTRTVYLSGSIAGHDSDFPVSWRKAASTNLILAGFNVLDPMRRTLSEAEWSDPEKVSTIIVGDLEDVRKSDIILVEMDCPGLGYVGTLCELNYAKMLNIPIIAWGRHHRNNPWFQHYLLGSNNLHFDTIVEALNHITLQMR